MKNQSPDVFHVVRGIILSPDGSEIAVAQRSNTAKMNPLMYEFPGGQVEEGESHFEALHREIRQEVGIDVLIDEGSGNLIHQSVHEFTDTKGLHRRRVTSFYGAWALQQQLTPDPAELQTGFWIEPCHLFRLPDLTVDTKVSYIRYAQRREESLSPETLIPPTQL